MDVLIMKTMEPPIPCLNRYFTLFFTIKIKDIFKTRVRFHEDFLYVGSNFFDMLYSSAYE